MSSFWRTVLPPVLTALVAYQGGLTRTTRLQRLINTNIDLLGSLRPATRTGRPWRPTTGS